MSEALTGGCLCGAVRYVIEGEVNLMTMCHCSRCRRWTGTNCSVEVAFLADQIRFTHGEDAVSAVEIPEIGPRTFCSVCGSCLMFGAMHVQSDYRGVLAGSLDDVGDLRPFLHGYVLSKAPWDVIPDDGLPSIRDDDPGDMVSPDDREVLDAAPIPNAPSPDNPLRGACLCGGVQYELTGPFLRANYCHCSRCRAHSGSWGLIQGRIASEHFRLVQGEDLLVNHSAPGHASKVFCKSCGSSVFGGEWPDGKTVSIRFGTLDADPAIRPEFHTFVEEMAPWDGIHDDLVQFPGRASREEYRRLVEGKSD